MNIRRFLYPALLILLVMSLGCTIYFMIRALEFESDFSSSASFHRPRYHFVLIPEEKDNPYWRLIEKGAQAAAARYDAVVEYNGPEQTNTDEHIKITEMAIASRVDGIITQGLSERMNPVINRAIQQGIPVVTADTDAPGSRRNAYVGTDNLKAGKMAGKALIQGTGGHANVAIITGSFQSPSQKLRIKGFREAIKNSPGIHIVTIRASHISRVQAAEETYQILLKYPDVTAFFGTSALDGLGISATAQSLGKTDDVYILAFDKLPDTLRLIKKGAIEATVAQKPYEIGYKSVQLMVDIANGQNVPEINHTSTMVIHSPDLPLKVSSEGKGRGRP
ncbi:MAG TPA: sugar-binding protein [Bacillales bacterium]|nr:sugar-binding protein [Bacillales bacterium]